MYYKSALISFFAGTAVGVSSSAYAEPAASRPNVLMISVDDLNDWVGALHGHPDTLTPNIDRLARKGVVFTDAHASSPLCGPSRAALLSGIRASTSGFHDNKSRFTAHPVLMDNENLPQFFKRQGYRTMGSGKIFHYHYPEFWDESLDKGPRMYKAGQPKRNGTDLIGIFDWGPLSRDDSEMDDYKMAQFAVDRLTRDYDEPFFLTCGIYLPHLPWYAPQAYFDKFPLDSITMPVVCPDDIDDLPPAALKVINLSYYEHVAALGPEISRQAVQAYLASVHFADAQVGRVLDALEQSSYRDNTIVVLFGDHGNHHGQKKKWHKDTLWRESTRAPLIIYAPGMTGNGTSCERMASLIDIYPTLAELVGAQPPKHLEGRSLKSLLDNPAQEWNHGVITNRRPGENSVRTEKWCYIRYSDGSEELYNREKDPHEWTNLAKNPEYLSVKKMMAEKLP
jgi:arylsulfatase A-like enzyme